MSDGTITTAPLSYWIIASAALIWNLFGVLAYYMQVTATPEQLAQAYDPDQVALLMAVPSWATSASAIATNIGALGCILLLLRKSLAVSAFIISLAGIIVQDIYLFGLTDSLATFGNFPLIMQTVVLLVAIGLILYSRSVANRYYR